MRWQQLGSMVSLWLACAGGGCGAWHRFWDAGSLDPDALPGPALATVAPDTGYDTGGTLVTLTGTDFAQGAAVTLGGMSATVTSVVATQLVLVTPPFPGPGAPTAVDVVLANPDGQAATRAGGFRYFVPVPWINGVTPASGSNAGGTTITLAGGSFVVGATVTVGGQLAGSVAVANPWQLTCVTPSVAPADGPVVIVVTNPNGLSGTLLGAYTMVGAPGTLAASFGTGGVVTSNPTSGSDEAWEVISDGTNLYAGGWDEPGGAGDYRIRVDKRSLANGAAVTGFGGGGAVVSDPSTGGDWVESMVSDGTYLYILGPDERPGPGDIQWRLEKRSLTSGALATGFGSGGAVTSNPSSRVDHPVALLTDGVSLYLVGLDSTVGAGNDRWRIEKRSKSTGALVNGFGSGGVVTSNPSAGQDWPLRAGLFGTDLYVVGFDSAGASVRWRIEKRATSTGALVAGFGSFGVVTSDPSTGNDEAWAVASDGTDVYVVGSDWSPGNEQWRIEKRSGSTGALVAGFGSGGVQTSDPSSGNDRCWNVAIGGPHLYAVGEDWSPGAGDSRWRVERRSLATGALDTAFGTNGVATVDPSTGVDSLYGLVLDATACYLVGGDSSPGNARIRIEKRWK